MDPTAEPWRTQHLEAGEEQVATAHTGDTECPGQGRKMGDYGVMSKAKDASSRRAVNQ